MDYSALMGGMAGGATGALVQDAQMNRQQQLLQQMMQLYGNLGVPTADQLRLGPSAFEGIQDNPELLQDQQGALSSLQQISDSGGLTLGDRAALNQILAKTGQATTARNLGVLDQAAQRGESGGGDVMAAQLAQNAQANNEAGNAGLDLAGQAQQRAMRAIMERGGLAGQMRAQDWQENSAKAQAQDMINRYNAQVPMDVYQAQLQRISGMTGQGGKLADWYQNAGKTYAGQLGALGQGAGEMAYAMGQNGNNGGQSGYSPTSGDMNNLASMQDSLNQSTYGSDPNEWNPYPG